MAVEMAAKRRWRDTTGAKRWRHGEESTIDNGSGRDRGGGGRGEGTATQMEWNDGEVKEDERSSGGWASPAPVSQLDAAS